MHQITTSTPILDGSGKIMEGTRVFFGEVIHSTFHELVARVTAYRVREHYARDGGVDTPPSRILGYR